LPLDLAVIGNCQVAALVDPLGAIVWMCLSRPDGTPEAGWSAQFPRAACRVPRAAGGASARSLA